MPGPTTRDTYVGKAKAATLAAVHQRRAETIRADHPACRVCGEPMVCGQARSNGGAHFTCDPSRAAFRAVHAKHDDACFDCWAAILRGQATDHADHEVAS